MNECLFSCPGQRRDWRFAGVCSVVSFALLVAALPSAAQTRTIRTTGEYRMGDNDTRSDAKRLALLDAKRLALEQVGTYVEGITEVRDLQLSRDELRAYTAGIVEVTEAKTASVTEGDTMVIRVDVVCEIDAATAARQIANLRKNQPASDELKAMKQQLDQLRAKVEEQTRVIERATTKAQVDTASTERRQALQSVDVNTQLTQAWVALAGSADASLMSGSSGQDARREARRLITSALAADPGSALAHHIMGVILSEEGDHEGAIREYREALRLNRNGAATHVSLGVELKAKKDHDGAIREYREALRLKPDDATAHQNLGLALYDKKDLDGAIREYHEALLLKPDDAAAHHNLGIALYDKRDLDGAIREYREALRFRPNYAEAHHNLGVTLYDKKDLDSAIREYREALRVKPDYANAHYGLGNVLAAKADSAAAIEQFRLYLRSSKDKDWSERARARIRELGGTP